MATAVGIWGETYEVEDAPVIETPTAETPETESTVSDAVTPPVVTETVETPAAEATTEPVTETPPPVETPVATEAIKEVEKIVEKYPEMDEHTGAIFQALMEGKEDVLLNYLSEKHRDYGTMSDYDVVKANLMKSNPNYTDEIAALKIEMQYGEIAKIDLKGINAEDEPDEYAAAVQHNNAVERNLKMLKIDAIDARAALETGKKEIKLPKIEQPHVEVPNQPTAAQIEQGRIDWVSRVETEVPNVKEFKFKAGNEDVGYEDVAYTVSDGERKEQLAFLKDVNMDKMVERLGWVDKTGKQDIQKMAGDVLKLEKLQQLVSSAYIQGFTTGTKGTVTEIKNLDLGGKTQTSVADAPPDIGAQVWGHINPK